MDLWAGAGAGAGTGVLVVVLIAGELKRRGSSVLLCWQQAGVVLGNVALWLAMSIRFLGSLPGWQATLVTFTFGVFSSLCLMLSVIDVKTHLLPDRFVLPAVGCALGGLGLLSLVLGQGWGPIARTLGAAALSYAAMFILSWLGGLGYGDVKLSIILGAFTGWLGWSVVGSAVLLSFISSGLFALVLVLLKRATAKTSIAFGPWLCLGALGAILLS